jgi:Lon-like protease
MIALTVYDKATPDVDLAAGRVVAGTGAVDASGRIGSIGGAGLKVLAAERIGADVFLAPAANYDEARQMLPEGSPMRIVPVETFEDARSALERTAGEQPRGGGLDSAECPFDAPA